MRSLSACMTAIVLSVFFITSCEGGISCFYCNSANNSACLDLRQYDEHTLLRLVPKIRCDLALPMAYSQQFFCRKIQQTILRPGYEAEVRVTRGCGWVPHHKPCYHNDNQDHLETVCQCFEDYCNSAPLAATPLAALAFAATLLLASYT